MTSRPACVLNRHCIAIVLWLPLALLSPVQAIPGPRTAAVDANRLFASIEEDWARALVNADQAGLDRHEAPGYVLVNAAGMTLVKAQADGELLNGHQHFDSVVISAVHAWRSGNLAVVTGHAKTREHYLGVDNSGDYEFTDIFSFHDGHWLAIHAQLTRVVPTGN